MYECPVEIKLPKVCRLCLDKTDLAMIPLKKAPDMIHKIKELLTLNIDPFNDKFPLNICQTCVSQINKFALFRKNCLEANEILLNFDDTVKPKPEQPDTDSLETGSSEEYSSSDSYRSYAKQNSPITKTRISVKTRKTRNYTLKEKPKLKKKKVVRKPKYCSEMDDFKFNDNIEDLEKYLREEIKKETQAEIRKEITKNNTYLCDICKTEFTYMFDYLDHQEVHSGQPVYKCERCEQVFSSRKDLVDHDKRHQIPCPKCGKLIMNACLRMHMVSHTDKFKCIQCNWRFSNNTMLKQHIISVHARSKTHVCETCGKSFTCATSLVTHMATHSDARPYSCKLCDYTGRTSSALYAHMSRHENGIHVCDMCPKTFKSFRSLRDHTRRVHSEKKNHICGFCQKKFVDRYMLTVHIRTHTGARPYQCKMCDRAFVRSDGLREHLATHGQRASYSCQQCGKKFIYRRSLGRHSCSSVVN